MRGRHGDAVCRPGRGSAAVLALCALLAGCEVLSVPPAPPAVPGPPAPPAAPAPAVAKPSAPPTADQMQQALTLLNRAFQDAYERILQERGTRTFAAGRAQAFEALDASLRRLGMITEIRDPEVGTLTVAAPAPRPLSAEEWRRVAETDTPMMAAITCPILGEYCRAIRFEPDDYVIVINATVLEPAPGTARISLTTRMREIAPRPGAPRRDYPPPTGVRMALDKIWGQFDQELAGRQGRAR